MRNGATVDASSVSARELRMHLLRRTDRLRTIYRCLVLLSVVVIIGLLAHVIFYYNYLTDLRFDVLTARGKVGAALQYRKNLMPVLAEAMASFVEHEDRVFDRTVDARERELAPGTEQLRERLRRAARRAGKAEAPGIRDLFSRVMAIAEQYPQLKTSEAFQLLMKQVADAESKIMAERTRYNDTVNTYTTALSMFPGNVYGYLFRFPTYDYFEDRSGSEWPRLQVTRASKDS